MTGYGRGTATVPGYVVNIELKAVNNRFLDVSLKLPGELQQLESQVKRTIGDRLFRGRIDVNLQVERTAEVTYELNRPVITGVLSAMGEMQREFGLSGEPDINVIARLPNVFLPKRGEAVDGELTGAVDAALGDALTALEKMRESEGGLLKTELLRLLDEIGRRLPAIEAEAARVSEEYMQRLKKKIAELLAKSESQMDIDQGRLAQEAAYLADRADISEEIARLSTHLDHFRSILDEDKDVGKRLDFLTQELNREANTITSKSTNMVVKENALQIKSDIEKIREQVQNVE
jgi:uncharacterized protein (TIGR00255 family)